MMALLNVDESMPSDRVEPDNNKVIGNHVPGIAFKEKSLILKFKYFYQYPYLRLFVSYFVIICNFLIYAEDPVAHSHSRCEIPVIGNAFSMIVTKYPPNAFSALKVLMWITAILLGIGIGKLIIHKWLFNKKLRVGMFSDDQGSWMICFLFTILTVLLSAAIYNLFLSIKGDMDPYIITGYVGSTNSIFMRAAALGSWFGDFITAWMVTDMMLQEKNRYKRWKPSLRERWNIGWRRAILFWFVSVILTILVIVAVTTDLINWDELNRDQVYTNELGRAFLRGFMIVMDFNIIMQDWDFPMFDSALDIRLPGVNVAHIKFNFPEWIKKNVVIHITGKWCQYGVLFIVLLLDLNMCKNQIFYEPLLYGQYTDESGHIYSVYDKFSLAHFGNATIFSYGWRNTTIDPITDATYILADYRTNSRYHGYSLTAKGMAFIPPILTFIIFGVFIHYFGKRPIVPNSNEYNTITVDIKNEGREGSDGQAVKNKSEINVEKEEKDDDIC